MLIDTIEKLLKSRVKHPVVTVCLMKDIARRIKKLEDRRK